MLLYRIHRMYACRKGGGGGGRRRNDLFEEIKQWFHDFMSEKHKKTCKYLNYVEHMLMLASTITGYVSISGLLN